MSVTTSFGVTNCKCLKLDTLPVEVEGQEVGQGCTEVEGHEMDVLFVEPMASRVRRGSIVRILPPWWVLNKTMAIYTEHHFTHFFWFGFRQQLVMSSGRVTVLCTALSSVVGFKEVSRSSEDKGQRKEENSNLPYFWSCQCRESTLITRYV